MFISVSTFKHKSMEQYISTPFQIIHSVKSCKENTDCLKMFVQDAESRGMKELIFMH